MGKSSQYLADRTRQSTKNNHHNLRIHIPDFHIRVHILRIQGSHYGIYSLDSNRHIPDYQSRRNRGHIHRKERSFSIGLAICTRPELTPHPFQRQSWPRPYTGTQTEIGYWHSLRKRWSRWPTKDFPSKKVSTLLTQAKGTLHQFIEGLVDAHRATIAIAFVHVRYKTIHVNVFDSLIRLIFNLQ